MTARPDTSKTEAGNPDTRTVGTVSTRANGWTIQVGAERHPGGSAIVTLYTPDKPGIEPAELTPAQARELGCLLIVGAGE